jgi:predicted dehydrogenase
MNRRAFLSHAAKSAALVSATALSAGKVLGANDRVRIALIGCGGRGTHVAKLMAQVPGAEFVGACDVFDENAKKALEWMGAGAQAHKDFRKVLERKDVDAVLVGAPDHWHAIPTVLACEAGKDVYVEKPLTHDLSEGRAVVEAQNKNNRIVQVGTQQRSMPQYQKAKELVRAGRIGRVHKAHITWNRNTDRVRRFPLGVDPKAVDWPTFLGAAPPQPFDEYRFRNWRWFWDFGGGIFTDLMVH